MNQKLMNVEYTLKDIPDNKVIYDSDWYGAVLGVEYVSDSGGHDDEVSPKPKVCGLVCRSAPDSVNVGVMTIP